MENELTGHKYPLGLFLEASLYDYSLTKSKKEKKCELLSVKVYFKK